MSLKDKLATLPGEPGCYLMKNKAGTIIYVGKAKKLKSRVNSYFVGAHDHKTTKLVSQIDDFDYFVTATEKESLLLEINLIKKYRPRFNIMFMDDKSYPYIKITNEPYPIVKVVRETTKDKKAKYFGPYPDATIAYRVMDLINGMYPMRKCHILPKKVCLYYHLHQCLGPCEFEVDPAVYVTMREEITRLLKGDTKELRDKMTRLMNESTAQLNYEKSMEYRDYLRSLDYISDPQMVMSETVKDRDVFAYFEDSGYVAIQGLFIRGGKLLDRSLTVQPIYDDPDDAFIAYILQYYQSNPLPQEILLPQGEAISALTEVLSTHVLQPQRGMKKNQVELAKKNAENNLKQRFQVLSRQSAHQEEANRLLAIALHEKNISRVELFDNSHIQGQHAVAGMVVFDDGIPNRKEYRLFKVHSKNDDLANMKEVLYRRYLRLLKENGVLPDLILVDGGQLQVSAAIEIRDLLDLDVRIAGLVKDDNHRTADLMNEEFQLLPVPKESPLFFLLTRMQDEVHRFALGYHQKLRSKAQTKSILDEVEGIGPTRKKELMKHFKTFKAIKEADVAQLEEVLPKEVALRVHELFHTPQDKEETF
ncbi:MAG TPA: excinuclease ABC subunit C [Erysipelotrichaceae bacterium]|nr:MAG: excinuclease ABC subunit C [Firmicutes bacterium GWE2_51_13]HAM63304.1 excinuclease ABC subunit C [Erysipelotrichaceae bacterium]HAO62321.1 excinuclease ABC subunit C [Erysipelotrichaceae bacterium]HBZ41046.1 excinuclease ABC subunit C [Erysipelotrichaceae bacterium]